jgi:Tfp pilus assembly protein PilV
MVFCRAKISGQTLIEALITVVFISFCVIALIRFQNYLTYDNSLAQQKSEATILAAKQIEQLRTFEVLNTTSGYTAYQSIASGSSTSTGTNATYTITWTVTANTNPTYKNASVTVSWTDRQNNAQSVQLVSHISGIDPPNSASIM